jgi:hypothetical protein
MGGAAAARAGDREELGALLSKALAQLEAASAAAAQREAVVAALEARVRAELAHALIRLPHVFRWCTFGERAVGPGREHGPGTRWSGWRAAWEAGVTCGMRTRTHAPLRPCERRLVPMREL